MVLSLTNEEEKLLRIKEVMSRHKGHENVITSKELMEILGVKEDATRSYTRSILLKTAIKYGMPIGATNKKPEGYFIITTQEELDACIGTLDRRKMKIDTRKK